MTTEVDITRVIGKSLQWTCDGLGCGVGKTSKYIDNKRMDSFIINILRCPVY